MKLIEAVGQRANNLLKEREMSQYALSKCGGIPKSTISVVIGAKRNAIKIDTIYQITETLGISLKMFFDDPIFEEITD